ncbi:DgyrCDS8756 [Dimorphilus gyrociliatus]|uniref:DgyrCDS8756 n=1 Tax=Dimorphilus gyrociliatus TaxID=2664684 RepID=A0A7I8VVB5_9ANNE|nr:DgyrCDS8756 [Dimorphilus gyrociliatus]
MRGLLLLILMTLVILSDTTTKKKKTVKQTPKQSKKSNIDRVWNDKIVDLTHPFNYHTPLFSEKSAFYEKKKVADLKGEESSNAYKYWAVETHFVIYNSAGTHIESPRRLNSNGLSVKDLTFDRLILPAVVIDIEAECRRNRNYRLTETYIAEWEKKHGIIPKGGLVLIKTGWSNYWKNSEKYYGTKDKNIMKLSWPGMDAEAAAWLVHNRKIYGVGIDAPSVDRGQSSVLLALRQLYDNNVYTLKNLADMSNIPTRGATVQIMPMLIDGAASSPTRVFASWSGDGSHKSGRSIPFLTRSGVEKTGSNIRKLLLYVSLACYAYHFLLL